jgi:NNP family nitrate/nitrite transporter-like MFS transporter
VKATLDHRGPASDAGEDPFIPGRWGMLNLTWIAFFLTFLVWYNIAAFKTTIAKALGMSLEQSDTLLLCNLALTIPARIGVGMLVDRFGPRRVFAWVLFFAAIPCLIMAFSNQYWQMIVCRLAISCVGAGFVVGIRLVAEWFDKREIGMAEGIYGGLGNFGMAAATFGLPVIGALISKTNGWRWAIGLSGAVCVVWGVVYYMFAKDAPAGREFKRPKKKGALEVTSRGDLAGLVVMQVPMVLCLGIMTWRLVHVKFLPPLASVPIYLLLAALLAQQIYKILHVNASVIRREPVPPEERYAFSQVAILCLCYAVTFGGELAVEQMLPEYFENMFKVSVAIAGIMAAGFAFANFIARPLGGILGDHLGRRPIMIVTLAGSAAGFFGITLIHSSWSLIAAMGMVVVVGLFLMAANGANFCIAPLIRKPLTGQIAGLIGAYGSVGSVLFTTVKLIMGPKGFFLSMAVIGTATFACCFMLREPGQKPTDRPAGFAPTFPVVPVQPEVELA